MKKILLIVLAVLSAIIVEAQQIVYRTTMMYATSQSQYADMRLASLQAAEDLHGAESAELASVLNKKGMYIHNGKKIVVK